MPKKSSPIRWGMIGCGAVTAHKSAPAYQHVAGSTIVAVASRNPENARQYARQNSIASVFDNAEDLVRSPEVDAVYVATPPSSHLRFALLAAEAGKPCCVEKPMALSYAEAKAMLSVFEAARLPLFVAYYRRSLPRFRHIKDWIDSGAIGTIRHVHWTLTRPPGSKYLAGKTEWRISAAEAAGGYFDDLACHGLNLFDFLIGPIENATGVCTNQNGLYAVPDAVAASWLHMSGATGSGAWNFAASAREDAVSVYGSKGKISFSVFEDAPLIRETGFSIDRVEIINPSPIQLHHVEAIIGHLHGRCQHPSTGPSAARTAYSMEQILRNLQRV